MTPQEILDLPMEDNDSGANTIRGYLKALLTTLWEEGEGFSGKRPFGNSCWEYDLFKALIQANVLEGTLDEEEGSVEDCDTSTGTILIDEAIEAL